MDKKVGLRIKELREQLGLTQKDLADKLGFTPQTVSNWEAGNREPDITALAQLATLFNVSLDYLLLGKEKINFSLDDLEPFKRAMYLIENDDAVNFEKYGYVKSDLLLCKEALRDLRLPKDNVELRNKIFECQSVKIFSLLADKLLEDLNHRKYEHMYMYYATSAACLFYDCLDEFVKLCALANKIELLSYIKFKSFIISEKENKQHYTGFDFKDFYSVKQETLDFIFMDKRVPQAMVDYVAKFEKYSDCPITYSMSPDSRMNTTNAYRMCNNVLVCLYKTKRNELMNKFVEDMKQEAQEVLEKYSSSSVDMCWRSSYRFREYGYMFYVNGNGSTETESCTGKISFTGGGLLECAINEKDKKTALWINGYIKDVSEIMEKLVAYKPTVHHASSEEDIVSRIKKVEKEETVASIRNDSSISEYDRRRKLFALGELSLSEVLQADDYDLFVQFPLEETSKVSVSAIARVCNNVKFYIFAVNCGQDQERLDDALAEILQRLPDRYDILDVLLSAGAVVKDNPSMTAILKQNVIILNQKTTQPADVKVDATKTKEDLLKQIEEGKLEDVVVNLAFQLEQKLKARYGNGGKGFSPALLDMIETAYNDSLINDLERTMLHNLRKSRNMVMHEGTDRAHFTAEVVTEWLNLVYKL